MGSRCIGREVEYLAKETDVSTSSSSDSYNSFSRYFLLNAKSAGPLRTLTQKTGAYIIYITCFSTDLLWNKKVVGIII